MTAADIAPLLSEMKALGAQLPEVKSVYPLQAASFAPPATSAAITALEQASGITLPEDYKAFLRTCSAVSAMDLYNGYALLEHSVVLGILAEGNVPAQVETGHRTVAVLPVGGDGTGNLFLLATELPFRVWKWHHETGPVQEGVMAEDSPGLLPIADGFSQFLRRIVEDWRHFIAGDDQWPYISG